jgi:hypothetical protein
MADFIKIIGNNIRGININRNINTSKLYGANTGAGAGAGYIV